MRTFFTYLPSFNIDRKYYDSNPASDYGAGLASSAQNSGNSAINSYDPTASANSVRSTQDNLFNTQNSASNNYTQNYANTISSNPTMQALYNQGNTQFNVPGLAQQATNLNNAVLQVPQNNVNLAKGFDYSAPQVQQQTAQDLARLSPLAAAATNQSQQAQNLAGQYVQAGLTQNQMNLLPIQEQGTLLAQNMAAQATGYNTAAQQELNGLMQKMQSGVTLSQAEMDRANTLAAQETSYQNQLTQAQAQEQTQRIAQQFQNVGAGNTLINTANGQPFVATGSPVAKK